MAGPDRPSGDRCGHREVGTDGQNGMGGQQEVASLISSVKRGGGGEVISNVNYKDLGKRETKGHIVQELCESRGGRPGLSVLTSLLVSVDVKND